MKKVITIATLAAFAALGNAQGFTEDFEPTGLTGTINGNTPGGDDVVLASGTWRALNNSVPVGLTGWFSNNTIWTPHGGTAHLCVNFNNSTGSNPIDSYFMSPVRTFKNGDTISFWTRTVDIPGFPDRARLKLSQSGASTSPAAFTTTLLTINDGLTLSGYPSVYTQFTATLSGLPGAGVSGRFAFHYDVPNAGPLGSNSDFLSFDDVVYTPAAGPVVAVPAVFTVIEGTPFGGNVASLAASDDNKIFILNDESTPNALVEFSGAAAGLGGGNVQLKVETSASRNDLSEFLRAFNYVTNAYVQVNFRSSSLTDVTTTVTTSAQFVSGGDGANCRIQWIPQTDLEAGDGWAEAVDFVEWRKI